MIIAATIGHAGRPSRLADRGAAFEGVEETSAVRRYTDALDRELRRMGHGCVLLSDGEYRVEAKTPFDTLFRLHCDNHVTTLAARRYSCSDSKAPSRHCVGHRFHQSRGDTPWHALRPFAP